MPVTKIGSRIVTVKLPARLVEFDREADLILQAISSRSGGSEKVVLHLDCEDVVEFTSAFVSDLVTLAAQRKLFDICMVVDRPRRMTSTKVQFGQYLTAWARAMGVENRVDVSGLRKRPLIERWLGPFFV